MGSFPFCYPFAKHQTPEVKERRTWRAGGPSQLYGNLTPTDLTFPASDGAGGAPEAGLLSPPSSSPFPQVSWM